MLTDMEIAKPITQAVSYVISTVAGFSPIAGEPYIKKNQSIQGDVSATVSVTGDRDGSISVIFTKKCAEAIVKGMLGEDIKDVIEDTKDTVGEVTNMISGHVRKELVDLGLTLHGSTPTVILGDNHILVHVMNSPVLVFPFETEYGDFFVEIVFSRV